MYTGDKSLAAFGLVNKENSPGVSAVAGELLGSCCMLRLADLVMRQFAGREVSLKALGEVTVEVEGVLEGVGVLSLSSESFNN